MPYMQTWISFPLLHNGSIPLMYKYFISQLYIADEENISNFFISGEFRFAKRSNDNFRYHSVYQEWQEPAFTLCQCNVM